MAISDPMAIAKHAYNVIGEMLNHFNISAVAALALIHCDKLIIR